MRGKPREYVLTTFSLWISWMDIMIHVRDCMLQGISD